MTVSFLNERFCKTGECPSSEVLLRYRRHRLPLRDRAAIEIHLRRCDFCSAELQLLTQHRGVTEQRRCVEIPAQLRRLAEDLLMRNGESFGVIDTADTHQLTN